MGNSKNKFVFYEYTEDEIDRLIEKYRDNGWDYEEIELSKSDEVNLLIKTPSRNKLSLDDCITILSGKLEFGNLKQIEALRALKFINILCGEVGHSVIPSRNKPYIIKPFAFEPIY